MVLSRSFADHPDVPTIAVTDRVALLKDGLFVFTTVEDLVAAIPAGLDGEDGTDGEDGDDGLPGPPGPGVETIHSIPANARRFAAKFGARTAANPLRIVADGDSITEGAEKSYLRRFRKTAAGFTPGNRMGPGWIPGSKGVQTNIDRDCKWVVTAGTGTETTDGLARNAISLATNAELTLQTDAGATATPVVDAVEFRYTASGDTAGSLELYVDGVVVDTQVTNDGTLGAGGRESGRLAIRWTGTRGPHTFKVKAITNAAIFDGAYFADGDTIYVSNGGHSSLAGNAFNAVQGPWESLANMGADLLIWAHGINDGIGSAAFYAGNISDAIDNARFRVADISIVNLIPYAVLSRTTWNTVYVAAAKAVDTAAGVTACDVSPMLDQPADIDDPHNLISDVDDIHPVAAGADLIGAALARCIFGFDTDFTTQAPADTPRYAVFSRSTTQNAPTATVTNLTPNTTNRAGDVDWTTFAVNTPRVAGWWRVEATVEFAANATGYREVQFYFNSTTVHVAARVPAVTTAATTTVVAAHKDIWFDGIDDFINARALQDSGSTLAVGLLQLSFRWMGP